MSEDKFKVEEFTMSTKIKGVMVGNFIYAIDNLSYTTKILDILEIAKAIGEKELPKVGRIVKIGNDEFILSLIDRTSCKLPICYWFKMI